MSDAKKPEIGSIGWVDLTVADPVRLRDFYRQVVGWESQDVDMGGYSDFNMIPPASDKPAAGICHARGGNADLPPQWLMYITVADLDTSLTNVKKLGGKVRTTVHDMGAYGRMCVIEDPAGAVAALIESAT